MNTLHNAHAGPPLVLIHVDGGIAEEWYVIEGTGRPTVTILDFDREGEDPEGLAEFIEYARETLASFRARGVDTNDLAHYLDKMTLGECERCATTVTGADDYVLEEDDIFHDRCYDDD